MKDFNGTELNVGDNVAYIIRTSTSGAKMGKGVVNGCCKRGAYNCINIEMERFISKGYVYSNIITISEHKVVKL